MENSTAALVFIGFSGAFLWWWVRWSRQRGFGPFTQYASGALLSMVVSIVLTAIVEVSFFKQSHEAKPAVAPAAQRAAGIEQQRQAFLQFKSTLFATSAPSDSAHRDLLKIMAMGKNGTSSVYDIYAQADRALPVHEVTWTEVRHLAIPAELADHRESLAEARDELAELIFQRRQLTEALMKALDEQKPKYVQEVQRRSDQIAAHTIRATLAVIKVQAALGIKAEKLAKP